MVSTKLVSFISLWGGGRTGSSVPLGCASYSTLFMNNQCEKLEIPLISDCSHLIAINHSWSTLQEIVSFDFFCSRPHTAKYLHPFRPLKQYSNIVESRVLLIVWKLGLHGNCTVQSETCIWRGRYKRSENLKKKKKRTYEKLQIIRKESHSNTEHCSFRLITIFLPVPIAAWSKA